MSLFIGGSKKVIGDKVERIGWWDTGVIPFSFKFGAQTGLGEQGRCRGERNNHPTATIQAKSLRIAPQLL